MVSPRDMPGCRAEVAWSTPWRIHPDGGSRLALDGTSGAYASTPDVAALDLTTLDVRARITLSDYTPATPSVIVSKWTAFGGARSYRFRLNTTGALSLSWSEDGIVAKEAIGTANLADYVAGGEAVYTRAVLRPDSVFGVPVSIIDFYYSLDGVTWLDFGALQFDISTLTVFASTAPLAVGASDLGTVARLTGTVDSVELRSSKDGPIVASPNFRAQAPNATSFTDAQGLTWTVAGTAHIEVDPLTEWTRVDTLAPLRSLSTVRGARLKVASLEAGVATGVFDNRTGALDPSNEAGPWAPRVKPRRRIRYILEHESGASTVHTGFIESLPPVWEVGDGSIAVTSTDLLALLAEEVLPPSVLYQTTMDLEPLLYWPMTEEAGTSMEDVAGTRDGVYRLPSGGTGTVVPYADGGQRFAAYCSDNKKVPQATLAPGLLNLPTAFSVSAWVRSENTYPSSPSGFVYNSFIFQQDGYLDGLGTTGPYLAVIVHTHGAYRGVPQFYVASTGKYRDYLPDPGTVDVLDGKAHHIVATYNGGQSYLYVDGTLLGKGVLNNDVGGTPDLPVGTSTRIGDDFAVEYQDYNAASESNSSWFQSHTAAWDRALTATEVADIYSAGANAWDGDRTGERLVRVLDLLGVDLLDRDVAEGSQTCGPTLLGGTFAAYLAALVSTEQGACSVDGDGRITFTERPANNPTPAHIFVGHPDSDGGGVPYMDVDPDYSLDRILNFVNVTREGGLDQRATNDASISEWGTRSTNIATLHATPSGARSAGARVTIRNGQPRLVFAGLTLTMLRNDVPLDILDADLGEAYTVKARPSKFGTLVSQLSLVERIELKMDWVGKEWTATLGMCEVEVLPCLSWDTLGSGFDESVWCAP